MELQPYIFFYGRCADALEFYKSVFGGEYETQPMQDAPDRVMHATFKGPGFAFMASDGGTGKTVNPDEGNIALSIAVTDKTEGEKLFNALAQGGSIGMPFGPAFWGGNFGVVTDKFGTEWMVTSE